jgi:hypothetical protein
MIFKSEHLTQASGSIGGVTYGRAKGGTLYRRARAIPVNPQTVFQTQVRSSLTDLVNRWIDTLTAVQRTAWNTWGANVLFTNPLGEANPISGQNAYIGANTARLAADSKLALVPILDRVDDAPTIFDRGDFTTPVITSYTVAGGFDMEFTSTDDWAGEVGGAMLIYQGRPRNTSRLFFKGPWRLIGAILGAVVPPSTPFTETAAQIAIDGFPLVAGQLISTKVVVVRADGRWSSERKLADTIVA